MRFIEKIKLYFYTIKPLKLKQIYWRIKYRFLIPKAPSICFATNYTWKMKWSSPKGGDGSWDGENSFSFLAENGSIDSQNGWFVEEKSALWLYNLHYLDNLNVEHEYSIAQEKALVDKWLEVNINVNEIGWAPYCISLRIVNLIKWSSEKSQITERLCLSIARQAESLMAKIEYPIMGNHLFANGKALVFAGTFLDGDIAERCLSKGLDILDVEVEEQFLADGAHFELSPMYHQILMWDMCDLVNLAQISGNKKLGDRASFWHKVIKKAEHWRSSMLHPDNEVAFFNDSTMGIAPPTYVIDNYLVKLGLGVVSRKVPICHNFQPSGYFAISQEVGHKLLINAAQISPQYQPGHAHADSLSFELSILGNRLFVNSGISMYGVSAKREKQRSTLAHNTLTIDNENTSQTWGGFRVAKRARIVHRKYKEVTGLVSVEASHDGYVQTGKGGIHEREWISSLNSLTIIDKVITHNGGAVVRFYLHPGIKVDEVNHKSIVLNLNRKKVFFSISSGKLKLINSQWYPMFGVSEANNCIEVTEFGGSVETSVRWDR
jgi:uncharacterized heparinase superfamily protein